MVITSRDQKDTFGSVMLTNVGVFGVKEAFVPLCGMQVFMLLLRW